MQKMFLLIVVSFFTISAIAYSETGDTTEVRTIEFTERRAGWFDFPEIDFPTEKIEMDYTLRCPPGRPCGEWDYIANVLIFHYFAPSYSVDGRSPATYNAMLDTSYTITAELVDGEVIETYTPKVAKKAYFYDHQAGSTEPIDSLTIWETYYTYTYDENANKTDSTLVEADTTFTLEKTRVYFDDDVTIREQHEMFRYITPYGNGLNLGEGFSWFIDVTDFKEYLSGKVYIEAHNGPSWWDELDQTSQEDLRLIFNFIEGVPERDVKKLTKLWQGSRRYNPDFEILTPEKEYTLSKSESMVRLKITQSGHGFGADRENCAEFCNKEGYVVLDGDTIYTKDIWRECATNPLYPQGGTWIFDRANWCPGEEVPYHNYELTDYIDGVDFKINYDMEYYEPEVTNTSATPGNYVITGYLVTYGEPNFQNDAEILDIVYPTKKQKYLRINPVNNQAAVLIKNRGSETLTSLNIKYGVEGGELSDYTWEGNLNFLDTTTVYLPNYERNFDENETHFVVELSQPNGVEDEYPSNNNGISEIDNTPVYPTDVTIRATLPNFDILLAQNPYRTFVFDEDGDIVFARDNYSPTSVWEDTLDLAPGNYTFLFQNLADFGLGFFAYQGLTRGSLSLNSRGRQLRAFGTDFGHHQMHSFRTDYVRESVIEGVANDTLDFGKVELGKQQSAIIKIKPKNFKGLTVNSANVVFGSAAKFDFVTDVASLFANPVELAEDEEVEIEIYFEPQKLGAIGSNLSIRSDDYYAGQRLIRLIGEGANPASVIEAKKEIKITNNQNTVYLSSIYGVDNLHISIMDIFGKTYKQIKLPYLTNYEIDISELSNGVYFIKVVNSDNIQTKKIMITK